MMQLILLSSDQASAEFPLNQMQRGHAQ